MSSLIVNSPQLVVTTALAGPFSGAPGGSASSGLGGRRLDLGAPTRQVGGIALVGVVPAASGEDGPQDQDEYGARALQSAA